MMEEDISDNLMDLTSQDLDPLRTEVEGYYTVVQRRNNKKQNARKYKLNDEKLEEVENLLVRVGDLWKCKVCGKTSTSGRRRNLRNHAEIHVEGLNYQCQHCNEICSTKGRLFIHIHNKHSKRSDDKYTPDQV